MGLFFKLQPGIVMLNNLIVRENAGQNSSLFLVLGTGTAKPEMIDLQIIHPPSREKWMEEIRYFKQNIGIHMSFHHMYPI